MSESSPSARTPGVFDMAFLTGVPDLTEVLLIRHSQQEMDFAGPVGLTIDPPLSERGLQQAEALGAALSTRHIDAIYASNLRRAQQTAAPIGRHQEKPVTIVEDLREVEIFRDIPAEKTAAEFMGREIMLGIRERMLVEKSWDVYPHSEGSLEFRRRSINAVEGIIALHPGERVAVVCHGGVINAYVGHVIASRYDMFFRPAHTSISVVAAGHGRRALHLLNDVRHLEAAEGELLSH
jgi:broad specificity phosphatase PhoE